MPGHFSIGENQVDDCNCFSDCWVERPFDDDDARVLCRRVYSDVCKIEVGGKYDESVLLGMGSDNWIGRFTQADIAYVGAGY